jgi:hypothetical protein
MPFVLVTRVGNPGPEGPLMLNNDHITKVWTDDLQRTCVALTTGETIAVAEDWRNLGHGLGAEEVVDRPPPEAAPEARRAPALLPAPQPEPPPAKVEAAIDTLFAVLDQLDGGDIEANPWIPEVEASIGCVIAHLKGEYDLTTGEGDVRKYMPK